MAFKNVDDIFFANVSYQHWMCSVLITYSARIPGNTLLVSSSGKPCKHMESQWFIQKCIACTYAGTTHIIQIYELF